MYNTSNARPVFDPSPTAGAAALAKLERRMRPSAVDRQTQLRARRTALSSSTEAVAPRQSLIDPPD